MLTTSISPFLHLISVNLLEKVCQNSTNSDNKHEMSFINGHRVNPQISRIHVVVCVTYALVQDAEVSGSKFGSTWDYLSQKISASAAQ